MHSIHKYLESAQYCHKIMNAWQITLVWCHMLLWWISFLMEISVFCYVSNLFMKKKIYEYRGLDFFMVMFFSFCGRENITFQRKITVALLHNWCYFFFYELTSFFLTMAVRFYMHNISYSAQHSRNCSTYWLLLYILPCFLSLILLIHILPVRISKGMSRLLNFWYTP